MEFVRKPLKAKNRPVKDPAFYTEWNRKHDFCAACGREAPAFGLSCHHIVKQGRSDESCNLLKLCLHPCHDLAEGLDVRGPAQWVFPAAGGIAERIPGALLPKLTIGICLSLKARADPQEMNRERLQELRGRRLPEPEEIPEWFERLMRLNRPELIGRS